MSKKEFKYPEGMILKDLRIYAENSYRNTYGRPGIIRNITIIENIGYVQFDDVTLEIGIQI